MQGSRLSHCPRKDLSDSGPRMVAPPSPASLLASIHPVPAGGAALRRVSPWEARVADLPSEVGQPQGWKPPASDLGAQRRLNSTMGTSLLKGGQHSPPASAGHPPRQCRVHINASSLTHKDRTREKRGPKGCVASEPHSHESNRSHGSTATEHRAHGASTPLLTRTSA